MPKLNKVNPNKTLDHLKRGERSKKFECPECKTKFKSAFFQEPNPNPYIVILDYKHPYTADCPTCGEVAYEVK